MNATEKKKSQKRKKLIKVLIAIVIVIAILAGVVSALKKRVTNAYASGNGRNILNAAVTTGSIKITVSGSGNLTDEDVDSVELPAGVEIKEFLVSNGDVVKKGDMLATVNMASVLSAMADVQASIDTKDEAIRSASTEKVSTTITATMSGRVKAVYAEPGERTGNVMYEHGALMLLSLDGYMAVDIECSGLNAEDKVNVLFADGTTREGIVAQSVRGIATVLVTDDGPALGENVAVMGLNGSTLGSGELRIHKELKVTGYGGTISKVNAPLNSKVHGGYVLFTLTDTNYGANYATLLKEREDLEEKLADLIAVYKENGLCAKDDGLISNLGDKDELNAAASGTNILMDISAAREMTVTISVDESDILSLKNGMDAEVTVDALGSSFDGKVTEIETAGTAAGGVTYYTVTVKLDKDPSMLEGMSASVKVRIKGVDNALLVPSDAITSTSSTSYVYLAYSAETDELTEMTEVQVGLNNGTYAEIISGLKEGDTVYYKRANTGMMGMMGMTGMGGYGTRTTGTRTGTAAAGTRTGTTGTRTGTAGAYSGQMPAGMSPGAAAAYAGR